MNNGTIEEDNVSECRIAFEIDPLAMAVDDEAATGVEIFASVGQQNHDLQKRVACTFQDLREMSIAVSCHKTAAAWIVVNAAHMKPAGVTGGLDQLSA
jgi:hypothetical protein